jgi:hypothetical protein
MIRLGLHENKTAFRPGELIQGAVLWELERAPDLAEVRLVWFTRGKGTEDGQTVTRFPFDAPPAADTRTFQFPAPDAPYSFSGKLIALIWAVEFVTKPSKEFQRIEVVIAPDAREIVLPNIPQPSIRGFRFRPAGR